MSHENIHYSVEDRVATITIDRPERRNAMTHAMNAEYARLIRKAGDDSAVQVLVVTGAGGAFCAGTDLSDFDTQTPRERSGHANSRTPFCVDHRSYTGSTNGSSTKAPRAHRRSTLNRASKRCRLVFAAKTTTRACRLSSRSGNRGLRGVEDLWRLQLPLPDVSGSS